MEGANCVLNSDSKQDGLNLDILFVIPPFHMRNGGGCFFPLGVGYIIAKVEIAGFTWATINCTEYINSFYDDNLQKLSEEFRESLSKYNPSIIGIGPCTTTQLRALKVLSDVCKEVMPDVPVFAGGPLASLKGQEWVFYEELGIPYLIKGDGEFAVIDAIRAVKKSGNILNSHCVSHDDYSYMNFIKDINNLPFPYREFGDKNSFSIRRTGDSNLKSAAMITSRGCPYSCNYCVSGNIKYNKKFRKRSINNILDEMEILKQQGVDDIVFYDDCFFPYPKSVNLNVSEFCSALTGRNLQMIWQIEMRPDVFCNLSEESIKKLHGAGCRQISLGIEKSSQSGLSFLGKQNCWNHLETQIKRVKSLTNISIAATFIFGGENETYEDVVELIKKSLDLQLDFAHYNPLFIYPGTPIYSTKFQDNKKWAQIIFMDDLPWGEIVYENNFLKREDLLNLVDYAYSQFYNDTEHAGQPMIIDRFKLKERK